MCHINFLNDQFTGSGTNFGTTGTLYIKNNDQKKKDLITRLLKDDLITLDDALLLLDKLPEPALTFGTTTTYTDPFTFTNTSAAGQEKDLIN
jgi:hypothetical protein